MQATNQPERAPRTSLYGTYTTVNLNSKFGKLLTLKWFGQIWVLCQFFCFNISTCNLCFPQIYHLCFIISLIFNNFYRLTQYNNISVYIKGKMLPGKKACLCSLLLNFTNNKINTRWMMRLHSLIIVISMTHPIKIFFLPQQFFCKKQEPLLDLKVSHLESVISWCKQTAAVNKFQSITQVNSNENNKIWINNWKDL